MKKLLAFIVATLVAVTTMACLIPSNALYVEVGDDLLEESGLGDPEYLNSNPASVRAGTADEDWEQNEQGSLWCGFSGGYGSVYSTREVVSTTLSSGSQGYALRFANDNTSGNSGCHNALTHVASIADIEGGKTYKLVVTVKGTGTFNGNSSLIYYSSAVKVGGETPTLSYAMDGTWNTYNYYFSTPATDFDGWIYIGAGDNWMDLGTEVFIEKVELYEVESDGEILNWEPTSACLAGDVWSVSAGQFCAPLQCPDRGTPGEAVDSQGARVYPTKQIAKATLPNGQQGDVVRLAVEAVSGYVNFGNIYGLGEAGLSTNKDYTAIVELKLTNPNPRTDVVVRYGETEVVVSASADWQKIMLNFNSGASIDNLTVGPRGMTGEAGAGYELLIASMRIYEADNVPETGDNSAFVAVVVAFSVALMATVVFTKKKAF